MKSDEELKKLRMRQGESEDEFKERFGLTDEEFELWKKITKNGTLFTGNDVQEAKL